MRLDDEHTEIAKNLWLSGLTTGEIVNYFKRVFTRSQILGKLWRMGIVGNRRPKELKMQDYTIKKRIQRAKEPTVLKPTVRSDGLPWAKPVRMPPPTDAAQRSFNSVSGPSYSLCDLGRFQCHWPLGTPGDKHFSFCSAPTLAAHPYCANHCAVAYNYQR